ncbi:hypothetical protein [Methylocapsa aurea]|uniref:hypothetical protein n=1 Tax=Methylocapsa aurea TaxID=663610 RepID=UPI003D18925A
MIKIELETQNTATLLASIQRRLEVIQQIEISNPERLSPELQIERGALVPAIFALERALKSPPPH